MQITDNVRTVPIKLFEIQLTNNLILAAGGFIIYLQCSFPSDDGAVVLSMGTGGRLQRQMSCGWLPTDVNAGTRVTGCLYFLIL